MSAINWFDTRSCWPSLKVECQAAPWHWLWKPRGYFDNEGVGFYWTVEWLFLSISLCGNDNLFELLRDPE